MLSFERSVAKLGEARAAGVDTLVDLTTMDNGRDVRLVAEIAAQVEAPADRRHRAVAAGAALLHGQDAGRRRPTVRPRHRSTASRTPASKPASSRTPVTIAPSAASRIWRFGPRLAPTARPACRCRRIPTSSKQSGLDQQRIYAEEGVDLYAGDHRAQRRHRRPGLPQAAARPRQLSGHGPLRADHFGAAALSGHAGPRRVIAELCEQGYADRLVLSHDAGCWPDGRSVEFQEREWPDWRFTHVPREVVPGPARGRRVRRAHRADDEAPTRAPSSPVKTHTDSRQNDSARIVLVSTRLEAGLSIRMQRVDLRTNEAMPA